MRCSTTDVRRRGGLKRLFAAALGLLPGAVAAALPASDDTVLDVLPRARGEAPRPVNSGRSTADAEALSVQLQVYLDSAERSGDARYLGFAESALASWPGFGRPPALRLQAAALAQRQHRFDEALLLLGGLLEEQPGLVDARRLRAYVYLTLGRPEEARADCRRMALGASPPLTIACIARVEGLRRASAETLVRPLQAMLASPGLSEPERLELALCLTELQLRLGDRMGAERASATAVDADSGSAQALSVRADLLLDAGRYQEADRLLAGRESHLGLLLLRAIAARHVGGVHATLLHEQLSQSFAAAQRRGDNPHSREYARYLLDLAAQPQQALNAALANWAVQRESEDALLVLRAAAASGNLQGAQPVHAWLEEHHIDDARLQPVLHPEAT